MIKKLRLALSLELMAFYFAAPYIILLALDDTRGLFDNTVSQTARLWCYALLVGFYPLLQSIVAPLVGRKLDQNCSKVSVLRHIHLANSSCYALLALACHQKSFVLALCALCIPGVVGCAAPVGKSLIASLTMAESRTKEFARLAFIKGAVKLTAPLAGAFLFQTLFTSTSYVPLFLVSATISFCCFLYSFLLSKIEVVSEHSSQPQFSCHALAFFGSIVKRNYPLLIVFVCLLSGYLVFVKYIPYIIFDKLSETPSLINYFSSVVGLAYCINQFVVVRFTKFIERKMPYIFLLLSLTTALFSVTSIGPLWFTWLFASLFCFSVLATCIEARLSLQPISGAQGQVQGVLYSVENWSYLIAPFIGSTLATLQGYYPLYFVIVATVVAATIFNFATAARPFQQASEKR